MQNLNLTFEIYLGIKFFKNTVCPFTQTKISLKLKFISLDKNVILDWYASHFITMNAHLPYNCTLRDELVITHTLSSTWKVFLVSSFIFLVVLDSQRNVVTWHIICTHIIIVFSESMATKKKELSSPTERVPKLFPLSHPELRYVDPK